MTTCRVPTPLKFLLLLLILVPSGHTMAQQTDPCENEVVKDTVFAIYPGSLAEPKDRSYQFEAESRHSYIYRESFEREGAVRGLSPATGAAWSAMAGSARDGDRYLSFTAGPEDIRTDPANWLLFGPFDLSRADEAHFNLYFRFGETEAPSAGGIAVLASKDGMHFHGNGYSGTTCKWSYRNFELAEVPELGDVCGSKALWIALLPIPGTAGSKGPVQIDFIRLLVRSTDHPDRTPQSTSKSERTGTAYRELLEYYSPYVVQELTCTMYGDKITRYDYDGDLGADNNWDNLGNNCGPYCDIVFGGDCEQARPLPAYVYASLTETDTDYYLQYALFHPADDFHCNIANHENDLEGMVVMVMKDGTNFGELRMVQLQWHNWFYQYAPPGKSGEGRWKALDTREDVDGEIELWGSHPVVYVEPGGHGLLHEHAENPLSTYIHYRYGDMAEDPQASKYVSWASPNLVSDGDRASYDLILTRCQLWQRRDFVCGSGCMFSEYGDVDIERFYIPNVGTEFDQDSDGISCDGGGAANPPWWWVSSSDEGEGRSRGEWFLDPAFYHDWQFTWSPPISTNYVYNPFLFNQICGEVYDILADIDTPYHDWHELHCDSEVPSNNSLYVGPGVNIRFTSTGQRLTAHGPLHVNGTGAAVILASDATLSEGVRIVGEMVARNGGTIRLIP
ncbi:MAG: hypothetical protein ABIK65_14585 [Candidatus Eisenbacteria bacterium]